jgi:peptidoglycan/xylan/chitin deacetylase (PgdA/CDA1 family)
MRSIFISFLILIICRPLFPQDAKAFANEIFLKELNKDPSYSELKKKIITKFDHAAPGRWGEFVRGVETEIVTQHKYVVFTFDACGGKNGDGCDKELIDFLHNERIPSTLFVTGKWIDANFSVFLNLSRDTLFDIENHGLNHKPCSLDGESAYGIKGTSGAGEAFDEIEANARKIEALTKHFPLYYRSATAYTNETCTEIAHELGITIVSYKVLSGDAGKFTPASVIEENVLKSIKPGAIVIMHINHPECNTYEAMQNIVPRLRKLGYKFVRLNDFEPGSDH